MAATAGLLQITAPLTMEQAIENGVCSLREIEECQNPVYIPEEELLFAPVVNSPQKIICIGVNYREHAEETNLPVPQFPVVFGKYNNTLAAHNQKIRLPKNSGKVDYEAELVLVIGKETFCAAEEDALLAVFGYTIGNDLSARDLQFLSNQWLIGKNCDHFAPVGPWIVTSDEIMPQDLEICCTVNGKVRQHSNTANMIFSCAQIVSIVSKYMTLYPGDLIFTGTPEGVIMGYPVEEQEWLKEGDCVEVFIQNIGILHNTMC